MKTRVLKWGNSLAVRIPKSFAEGLGFGEGSPAEMDLEDGAIVLKPDRDRVWDLGELLDGVTDDNLHPAWESGAGVPDEMAGPVLRQGTRTMGTCPQAGGVGVRPGKDGPPGSRSGPGDEDDR